MLRSLGSIFLPAPAKPRLEDPAAVARSYARWRWSVFLSITLGYSIFYVARLSTSVSKESIITGGILSASEMGVVDSVFLLTYAIGKTTNGFLADRLNPRPFFATALLVSGVLNLFFGLNSAFAVFILLWALNGWVQSVGVPASGVVMSAWFSKRQLGTRYTLWSMAHHIGEGVTFLLTARVVTAAEAISPEPWRYAFYVPGVIAIVAAFILYRTLSDRPETKGLPHVGEYMGEPAAARVREAASTIWRLQIEVLANPWIWVCGLASALIYVARYAINNWGVFYLQFEKDYTLEDASGMVSLLPIVGIVGTLAAGPLSDRVFGGRRAPVTVGYAVILFVMLGLFYLGPHSPWLDALAMSGAGFAMGGLLAFLGGLIAMDLSPRRTAGAALGVVGGMSYIGAGLQSLISGFLIEANHQVIDGKDVYDFDEAKWVWLGAPAAALVLSALLWLPERRRLAAGPEPETENTPHEPD
jgi:OPA family sugar phosphate sensor protein UhpC-like MFS transporter